MECPASESTADAGSTAGRGRAGTADASTTLPGRPAQGQPCSGSPGTGLLVGAARAELDPGQDGDGHQQPGGEQHVHGEAEHSQGHDGDEDEGDDGGHGDRSFVQVGLVRSGRTGSRVGVQRERSWRPAIQAAMIGWSAPSSGISSQAAM